MLKWIYTQKYFLWFFLDSYCYWLCFRNIQIRIIFYVSKRIFNNSCNNWKKCNCWENVNNLFVFFVHLEIKLWSSNYSRFICWWKNNLKIRNIYCSYFNSTRCRLIRSETPHTHFSDKQSTQTQLWVLLFFITVTVEIHA